MLISGADKIRPCLAKDIAAARHERADAGWHDKKTRARIREEDLRKAGELEARADELEAAAEALGGHEAGGINPNRGTHSEKLSRVALPPRGSQNAGTKFDERFPQSRRGSKPLRL